MRSPHLGCTFARPDAYMLALNAAWRDVRIGLGREAALRTLGLWLFAPSTYAERPELVEALLQSALANPYPQSVTGFSVRVRRWPPTTRVTGSPPFGALHWSASPRTILVPPRFSREIAALVPGAELRVIPAAGHGYFLQQPEAFNSLALDFLARFHATIRRIVLRLERRPTSRTSNVAGQSGAG